MGASTAGSKRSWMICSPTLDSAPAGRISAPDTPVLIFTTGLASTRMTTMTAMNSVTGWRMTHLDHASQKRPSGPRCRYTRSALMRGPSMPSMPGSSVRAAATETSTTSEPPMPMERNAMNCIIIRPARPTITARPLKKIERPARATVVSTACATVSPAASCSRKRPTMSSE